MSRLRAPRPARLVIGIFTAERSAGSALVPELVDRFGPLALVSPWIPFGQTDYYAAEMGGPLFRRLLGFARPMDQDALVGVKLTCMAIENHWSEEGRRRINIDPGYLLPSRFVLATGKDHAHRIYLGKSVYADLTLLYTRGEFRPLPWTYPGYQTSAAHTFLDRLRRRIKLDADITERNVDRSEHGSGEMP